MLPLLILVVPPTVAGGCYISWSTGEALILKRYRVSSPPPQSAGTYTAGLLTLAGAYSFQSALIHRLEQSGADISPTAGNNRGNQNKSYVPPQNFAEVVQFSRPMMVRLGAAGVAFFCAGAVQTYISLPSQYRK